MEEYSKPSKATADRKVYQEEKLEKSAQIVSEKYPCGTIILFNDKAPEILIGKKAYFQGVDRNNNIVNIELFESTRPNGPTQVSLNHGWGFDIHAQAESRGIFD